MSRSTELLRSIEVEYLEKKLSSDEKIIDKPSKAHSDLLKTSHKWRPVQRFREHVTLVICRRAVRNGTVQLWLGIYLSGENVFFHFWEEGLMQRANASTLDTG